MNALRLCMVCVVCVCVCVCACVRVLGLETDLNACLSNLRCITYSTVVEKTAQVFVPVIQLCEH